MFLKNIEAGIMYDFKYFLLGFVEDKEQFINTIESQKNVFLPINIIKEDINPLESYTYQKGDIIFFGFYKFLGLVSLFLVILILILTQNTPYLRSKKRWMDCGKDDI